MTRTLVIGAGGVGSVAIHKMAMCPGVFGDILLLVLVLRSLAVPVLSATTASFCPARGLRAFRTRDEKEGGSRFVSGCARSWQKTRLSSRALHGALGTDSWLLQ